MKLGRAAVVASLVCAACTATMSLSPTTGLSGVSAASAQSLRLQVIDVTKILIPTATDYANNYVEVTGAMGLAVEVGTNSVTGCVLFVKCADAAPQIALPDLLVKTQAAPGAGGTSMMVYTEVTASDQALWSTGTTAPGWTAVSLDLRIRNLSTYADGVGGSTTNYTDNLTFTLVTQ
jgi:hypothetical protein